MANGSAALDASDEVCGVMTSAFSGESRAPSEGRWTRRSGARCGAARTLLRAPNDEQRGEASLVPVRVLPAVLRHGEELEPVESDRVGGRDLLEQRAAPALNLDGLYEARD